MLWWQLKRLKSKNPWTLIDAAKKLGKYKEPQASKALYNAVRENSNSDVIFAAIKSLGEIGDYQAISFLLILFEIYNSPHIEAPRRARAIKDAILQIGVPAIPILTQIANDQNDKSLSFTAYHFLRVLKEKAETPSQTIDRLAAKLTSFLASNNDRQKAIKASKALQEFRCFPIDQITRHVEKIMKILDSNSFEHDIIIGIHSEALKTLVYAIGKESQPRLLSAIKSLNKKFRETACDLLSSFKDKATVQKLIELLNDQDDNVRASAISTLGSIGRESLAQFSDLSFMDYLVNCLSDKCGMVRESAAYTLGALGETKAIPALKHLLEDPYEESVPWETWIGNRLEDCGEKMGYPVREAASKALANLGEKPKS